MRDLKADLELCNKIRALDGFETDDFKEFVEVERIASEYAANVREGWPHAIERAIKAEALARELAGALEVAFELLEDHQPNWYLMAHFHQINNALGSYKEALGDEAR